MIEVYVKLDLNNIIIDINSSIFIDGVGYQEIASGDGDKFAHAQNMYLEKGLIDVHGNFNYKLVDRKVIELTEDEKEKLFPTQAPEPTQEEILSKELANIKIDNMKKDLMMTNALQTIASLKVEVMGLKGGNA